MHACVLSCFSRVQLLTTIWTVDRQVPLSVGSSRQYWSGLPFPPPGSLPNPETELASPLSPTLAGRLFTTSATWNAHTNAIYYLKKPKEAHWVFLFFFIGSSADLSWALTDIFG